MGICIMAATHQDCLVVSAEALAVGIYQEICIVSQHVASGC
jgi:hypothetical protein